MDRHLADQRVGNDLLVLQGTRTLVPGQCKSATANQDHPTPLTARTSP